MKKLVLAFWVFIILNTGLYAQKTISGKVTSKSDGLGIPGVNVTLKNDPSIGTSTDIDGNYSLVIPTENEILVFSSIGMQTIEISANRATEIVMQEDSQVLGEVVVVGFGTQKKVNLTGSVATIDSKELESRPVTSAAEALQGVVPGLNITTAKAGGQLNSSKDINIRGGGTIGKGSKGDPLVLIDGMEGDISALNPQDIANISVLKDAAASSIYGSRAPFGVILVTTKQGSSGQVKVNYNNSFRFDSPIHLAKMADSYSFALYFNDADLNGDTFTKEKLQKIKDFRDGKSSNYVWPDASGNKWGMWGTPYPAANTDWIDTHYKDYAFSQEHAISVSGGTDKSQYYLSGNFLDKNGILEYADENFNRYTFTAKINSKINNYLSIGYTSRFIRNDYTVPSYVNKSDNVFFHNISRYWPIIPVKDPNGFYTEDSKIYQLKNGGQSKEQKDWLYQQLSVIVEPIKNWKITGELNYRTINFHKHKDFLTTHAYTVNKEPYISDNRTSSVWEENTKSNFFNPNLFSEYLKEFNGGHTAKIMLGFQAELFKDRSLKVTKQDIITPALPTLPTSSSNDKIEKGGYGEWATVGFFGRLNYDYKGRYLAEVNMRYDGTSRFLQDKRWKLFPSFSLGWNIAREDFWEPLADKIGTFKVRGSWGELGNQNTENWYPFYSYIDFKSKDGNWLLGGKKPNTSEIPNIVSSLLSWEIIRSWNIGLDISALSNRLNFTFDYFNRKTKDMVGPAPELPEVLGADVPSINNADLQSKGFELSISWRDKIGEVSYGAGFVLSDNREKVTRYSNEAKNLFNKWGPNNWYSGRYSGEIWGYTTKGIAKTQKEMDEHLAKVDQSELGSNWGAGDIMYKDLDGDGKISKGESTVGNSGDYSIIGNSSPRFQYGISLDAEWKGIDLKIFMQGVAKRDYLSGGSYFWGANGGKWQTIVFEEHLDYFRDDANHPLGQNLNSYYPRLDWNSGKNKKRQSKYLLDASYIRLKNIQLGYTLPKEIVGKIGLRHARFFVSGENLLTVTSLTSLFDPETIEGNSYWGDGKTYPLSKTVSLGLSITF